MAVNQKPSVSSLPTVCEVEEILSCLLNNNNVISEDYEEKTPDYDLKTTKLLSSWICSPQRTPQEIYELIGPKFEKLQGDSENKLTQSFLAAIVLDALGVISETTEIVLTGHWAKILWCIIRYLYDNTKGENMGEFIFHPSNLHSRDSSWILSACNKDICPNHALRLELFGLIWAKNYLNELGTEQTVEFFVQTLSELDIDYIYNNHAQDLLFSAEDFWVCFDRFDEESYNWLDQMAPVKELTDIGQKIVESLLYYEFSKEVKFLQNIFKLTGILAKIARFRFPSKSRLLRKWINDCLTLFMHKFNKFFKGGMEKFSQICLHPFIYPYYIDLVSDVTNSILDLSGKLNKLRRNKKLTKCRQEKFRRLETRRNYMVYRVDLVSPPLNLSPLLFKQELGLLKLSNQTELQKKVLSQPNLPLSVNYSEDRVDFSQYNDQLIDYDFLNLEDTNDDEESDDDDELWESDNSDDYESLDSGNFENEQTIRGFIRNVFRSITNDGENSGRMRMTESEMESDDTADSNASESDETSGGNLADMLRRLNDIRNDARTNRHIQRTFHGNDLVRDENEMRDNIRRVISAVQEAPDTDDASVDPSSDDDDDDNNCMVQ